MELTKEFFEDVYNIRVNNDKAVVSLESLIHSELFTQVSVFHGGRWATLCMLVESRRDDLTIRTKEAWYDLVRPEMFLAIREMDEATWDSHWNAIECDRYDSTLYWYLINRLIRGIERDLLNGTTLDQELLRGEQEWPDEDWADASGDELDTYIPENMIAPNNTEEEAMNNILLQEIKDYLDHDEWLILTGVYGDDPELAESLGISVAALHTRRNRIRKRVLILFAE